MMLACPCLLRLLCRCVAWDDAVVLAFPDECLRGLWLSCLLSGVLDSTTIGHVMVWSTRAEERCSGSFVACPASGPCLYRKAHSLFGMTDCQQVNLHNHRNASLVLRLDCTVDHHLPMCSRTHTTPAIAWLYSYRTRRPCRKEKAKRATRDARERHTLRVFAGPLPLLPARCLGELSPAKSTSIMPRQMYAGSPCCPRRRLSETRTEGRSVCAQQAGQDTRAPA